MTCLSCQPYQTALRMAAHTITVSSATEQPQESLFLSPCQTGILWDCLLAWSCRTPCSCRLTFTILLILWEHIDIIYRAVQLVMFGVHRISWHCDTFPRLLNIFHNAFHQDGPHLSPTASVSMYHIEATHSGCYKAVVGAPQSVCCPQSVAVPLKKKLPMQCSGQRLLNTSSPQSKVMHRGHFPALCATPRVCTLHFDTALNAV